MRISTAWSQQAPIKAMTDKQANIDALQKQISSGVKNVLPSDDPVAARKVLDLQSSIDTTLQYQRNTEVANSHNSYEEVTLNSAENLYFRAKEISIAVVNGILSDDEKATYQEEVDFIMEDLVGLANTQNESGDYIFSGGRTDTEAVQQATDGKYYYYGDNVQRKLAVDDGQQIADGDLASGIFFGIDSSSANLTGGVTSRSVFDTLQSLSATLAPGGEDATESQAIIGDLDEAFGQLVNTRASVGNRMKTLDTQEVQHEDLVLNMRTVLSDIKDLDYAEAISQFNSEITALQAAQQSYVKVQGLSLFDYI